MPRKVEVDGGFIFVPTEEEEAEIERRKQIHREEEARKEVLAQSVEDISKIRVELANLRDEVKTLTEELQELKGELE